MDRVLEVRENRIATWHPLVLLATLLLAGLVGVAFSYNLALPALSAYGLALGMMLVGGIVGAFLARRERYAAGFLILAIAVNAHTVVNTLFINDYAVVFLGFSVLVVWLQARQFVSSRWLLGLIGLTTLTGLVMVLLDFYIFPERPYDRLGRVLAAAMMAVVSVYALSLILREYKDYPLRTKLITATLAAAIISIGVNIVISVQISSNAVTEDIGNDLRRLAESEALAVSEFLARQIDVLSSVTLNGTLRATINTSDQFVSFPIESSDAAAQGQFANNAWAAATENDIIVNSRLQNGAANALLQFQNVFGLHSIMVVTDVDGNLLAATDRPDLFYFGDEMWWQDAFNSGIGRAFVGTPYPSAAGDQLFVDMAVPIRSPQSGELIGILYSQYNLQELLEVLAERGADQQAAELDLMVGNRRFNAPVADAQGMIDIVDVEMVNLLNSADEFTVTDFDGVPSFVAMAPLDTLGHVPTIDRLDWGVLVHQSEAVALQPVIDQTRITILVGLGILIFTTIIAAYVAGLIAQPIVKLTETAVRVADGDLTARADASTRDELGVLSTSFNIMTDELERSVQELEIRVAERTRALELSTQVGRRLTTILDADELLSTLVNEVQRAFDYYHVQVYLRDRNTNRLNLQGATGEVGELLLRQGHTLLVGQGIVGQSAARMTPLVVPDVSQSTIWFPNELLPDTKAEIAVPITVGEQLLGVLDIQQSIVGSLGEEDISTLETISAQVATALQNARSYERARNQAAQEILINEISQKIQSATDVDVAMQIAVRELGRALGKAQTRVTLYPGQKVQTKELQAFDTNGSNSLPPDARAAQKGKNGTVDGS